MSTVLTVGMRGNWRTFNGPWGYLNRQHITHYSIELPGGLLTLAGGLSAVSAIGTPWRDPIISRLTRWRLTVEMDTVAESEGRNPGSKDDIQWVRRMSALTRDATPEPVSRDQILRRERGQRNLCFPVQLTTIRIGNHTG